ncbi:transcriptional regulator GlxA family with amidase domain [Amycolatopsis bartoniae]|uniref:AraC family transcriptional regulator n=1 Tax=Amycolatopsis bartoniae TaxID=941986 RepID=A0A8H9J174_9PSEU|nr:GlxA family transcriptional regulator [Amycolatopsis bartoniae]MBB2935592.1 transcriptional regulator GlxA family with amidase domain [Amycolatopsis bartoniae]TVT05227.1 GlxA family transcriptional regulator [Amycolatopsis bartoniae]GHF76882.1 AraC family transcriptional regulator [Amycolatopsis bartoniae]
MGKRRVALLVFDGVKLLDVAGPSEVFAEANRFGADYELVLCSVGGRAVSSSTGMRIPVDAEVEAAGPVDTALIAGGDVFPARPVNPELARAAVALAGRARRTASICTGTFVLAAAGLLDGRRATTHWQHADRLARAYPRIEVEPDAIFVEDGPVFTSAGVSAGIDLALALVERDHGGELARSVARSLVVFLQRPGGQSQFSPSLRGPAPRAAPLRKVCDAVVADPAADHTLPKLAAAAGVSARHLTRLFQEELGTTPAKYVELVRFDAAKAMLDAGVSVTDTVHASGFGSAESLRRSFLQHVGVPPKAYQQRFRTSAR